MLKYSIAFPENDFLAWDGRRGEGRELYLEPPENYPACTEHLSGINTVVVKVGSGSVGCRTKRNTPYQMHRVAEALTRLRNKGKNVILVSSGANAHTEIEENKMSDLTKAAARYSRQYANELTFAQRMLYTGARSLERLSKAITSYLPETPGKRRELANKLRYGQRMLYRGWLHHFSSPPLHQSVTEFLITNGDWLKLRERRIKMKEIRKLFKQSTIPIVNEDDARAVLEGISENEKLFPDNDWLSCLLAQECIDDGVLMINLTDARGLRPRRYFEDEKVRDGPYEQRAIAIVKDSKNLECEVLTDQQSPKGRGGMLSKVEANITLTNKGGHGVIANGNYWYFDRRHMKHGGEIEYDAIGDIMNGRFIGTRFLTPSDYQTI